eukprot:CAMPEP_0178958446 /NCGR_PEP_ID=MMETSP0789-20121207/11629_1 /TAXON_ID=3005 /ORGANISM="Rhizosolenia setigera, Strain CCMP 1694" /LENGTH=183 /DNA_ID=CAMNT_0020641117 /DNA_START=47 /DNA_END=598 /DNA_ORIENTATION=+
MFLSFRNVPLQCLPPLYLCISVTFVNSYMIISPIVETISPMQQQLHVHHPNTKKSSTSIILYSNNNSNNNNDDRNENNRSKLSLEEKINDFLDRPFFDPEKILEEEENDGESASSSSSFIGKWKTKFALFVTSDYETAEALYVGLYLTLMVIGTQELLRMQMYGDNYVPFVRGGKFGGGGGFF